MKDFSVSILTIAVLSFPCTSIFSYGQAFPVSKPDHHQALVSTADLIYDRPQAERGRHAGGERPDAQPGLDIAHLNEDLVGFGDDIFTNEDFR